jgi:heterodisulfide reductase subunit A
VVLYKELMTYGFREKYYTEAREKGVLFVRYTDENQPQVYVEGDELKVKVRDEILGQDVILSADLLALSTATVPAEGTSRLAEMLGVPLSPEGFFMEDNLKLRPMDSFCAARPIIPSSPRRPLPTHWLPRRGQ